MAAASHLVQRVLEVVQVLQGMLEVYRAHTGPAERRYYRLQHSWRDQSDQLQFAVNCGTTGTELETYDKLDGIECLFCSVSQMLGRSKVL